MKADHQITITMSLDGCWWKCGERQRRITRDQAQRVLNAARPQEIIVRSAKSGDVVLKQRLPDRIKGRDVPELAEEEIT